MKPVYDELYFRNEAAFSDAIYHIREAIKAVHKVKAPEDQSKAFMQCYNATIELERQHRLLQGAQSVIAPLATSNSQMQARNLAMLNLCSEETKIYSK